MKKLFIVLAVVGLINIGSVLYYETKLLDEPIIIANEVNLGMNSIHLSYITNLMQPSEFQSIEIDGMQYYPQNDFFMFYDSNQPIQTESYANYTYYSIFSPTIWIQTDDDLVNRLKTVTEGTVHFKDGHTETITLNVRQRDQSTQLVQMLGSGGTDGSVRRYKVVEPFTLNSVTVVNEKVELVSFRINQVDVPLPLELPIQLKPSDAIYVATTNGMARFDGELSTIELGGIDKQGNELVIPLIKNLNDRPSMEWVDEIVKERGNK